MRHSLPHLLATAALALAATFNANADNGDLTWNNVNYDHNTSVKLVAGGYKINPAVSKSGATITYSSENSTYFDFGEVSGALSLKPKALGSAWIRATAGSESITITVTVTKPDSHSILWAADVTDKTVGSGLTIPAPSSPTTSTFSFSYAPNGVFSYTENADKTISVRVLAAGTGTITCTAPASDGIGAGSKTWTITVAQPTQHAITGWGGNISYPAGMSVTYGMPTSPTNGTFTFTTDKPNIATVEEKDGRVIIHTLAEGTAKITATAAGGNLAPKSEDITLTVTGATHHQVSWSMPNLSIQVGADDYEIPAPTTTTGASLDITIDNSGHATMVERDGKKYIHAVSAGETVLTCTASGNGKETVTLTRTITVTAANKHHQIEWSGSNVPRHVNEEVSLGTLSCPTGGTISVACTDPTKVSCYQRAGQWYAKGLAEGTGLNIEVSVAASGDYLGVTTHLDNTFDVGKEKPAYDWNPSSPQDFSVGDVYEITPVTVYAGQTVTYTSNDAAISVYQENGKWYARGVSQASKVRVTAHITATAQYCEWNPYYEQDVLQGQLRIEWKQPSLTGMPCGTEYGYVAPTCSNMPGAAVSVAQSSSDGGSVTIAGERLTATAVGTVKLTATATDHTGKMLAGTKTITIKVIKGQRHIDWTMASTTAGVGHKETMPAATSDNGGTVTYSTSSDGHVTLSGMELTWASVGSTTVTASVAGDRNYDSNSLTRTMTAIAAGGHDATWNQPALADLQKGDVRDITPVECTTLPANMEITYASTSPDVFTVAKNASGKWQLTVTGYGSAQITATIPQYHEYNETILHSAAQQVKAPVQMTIAWDLANTTGAVGSSVAYVEPTSSYDLPTVTFDTGADKGKADVYTDPATGKKMIRFLHVGTYELTASIPAKKGYIAATVTRTMTITQGKHDLQWGQGNTTADAGYVGTITPATSATGATITYSSSDATVMSVDASAMTYTFNAGQGGKTATLTATAAATADYAAVSLERTMTVRTPNAGAHSVTWSPTFPSNLVKGGKCVIPPASCATGSVTYSSSDPTKAKIYEEGGQLRVELVDYGTVTLTASVAASDHEGKHYDRGEASAKVTFNAPAADPGTALQKPADKGATDSHATPTGTTYYDLLGKPHQQPVKGINIVVTRYSDGSTTTKKMVRK